MPAARKPPYLECKQQKVRLWTYGEVNGVGDLLDSHRTKTLDTFDIFQFHVPQVVAGKDCVESPETSFCDGSNGANAVESHHRCDCPDIVRSQA